MNKSFYDFDNEDAKIFADDNDVEQYRRGYDVDIKRIEQDITTINNRMSTARGRIYDTLRKKKRKLQSELVELRRKQNFEFVTKTELKNDYPEIYASRE